MSTKRSSVQHSLVERDLPAVCSAIFVNWDCRKDKLNHQYLSASSARISYHELVNVIGKTESDTFYARLTSNVNKEPYQVCAVSCL